MSDNKEKIITLRCDEELHRQFAYRCKKIGSNVSVELRLFMEQSVENGKIMKSDKQDVHTNSDFRDNIRNIHNTPPLWK